MCSLPVVLADGLTLPCSQLIDWPQISRRVRESGDIKLELLLRKLPWDKKRVRRMRHEACAYSELFFGSDQSHDRCLFLSAAVELAAEKARGYFHISNLHREWGIERLPTRYESARFVFLFLVLCAAACIPAIQLRDILSAREDRRRQ